MRINCTTKTLSGISYLRNMLIYYLSLGTSTKKKKGWFMFEANTNEVLLGNSLVFGLPGPSLAEIKKLTSW